MKKVNFLRLLSLRFFIISFLLFLGKQSFGMESQTITEEPVWANIRVDQALESNSKQVLQNQMQNNFLHILKMHHGIKQFKKKGVFYYQSLNNQESKEIARQVFESIKRDLHFFMKHSSTEQAAIQKVLNKA